MKTKNQQHQKTIEEFKRQNAAVELQSIKKKPNFFFSF
jgi:hypothetical protein